MRIFAIVPVVFLLAASYFKPADTPPPSLEEDFRAYILNFRPGELPHAIGKADFYGETRKPLSREISNAHMDFIPFKRPRYSRMGPDDYTYEASLAISNRYRAVIVGSKRPFSERPEAYHLITYTPQGKMIDHQMVAWSYGRRDMGRCTISKSGEIVIEHCENHLNDDRDIVGTDVEETEFFLLTDTGDIVSRNIEIEPAQLEVEQKQSPRASLDE